MSKRSLRTFLGRNVSLDASLPRKPASFEEPRPRTPTSTVRLRPQTANSKRRRRQTPYQISAPLVADLGRHAPLEPLVLHHRREVTGSDVGPLPPQVDIDNDISEAATLLAINEYFDSQESALPVDQSTEPTSRNNPSTPATSLEQAQQRSPHRDSWHVGDEAHLQDAPNAKQSTPSLPERNPERLSRINTPISPLPTKTASSLSIQSDFTSAAKGQYSPYDERCDTVPKALRRVPVPTSPQGRSTSSASGKLAPRIPGHEELASSRLNDFNYFLRMTGPSPPYESKSSPKKKKKGLKVIKSRNRKDGRNNFRSRHAGDETHQLPACAREMSTKAGSKHLRIVIPGEDVVDELPRQELCCNVGEPWTDGMMQSFTNNDFERTTHPTDATAGASKSPRISPKRTAVPSPMNLATEDNSLLVSRKEATRSRKLRDLKKSKGMANIEGPEREEKMKKMEWLVGELAEGLAVEAGIEGDLGPEEVLNAWRAKGGRGRVDR